MSYMNINWCHQSPSCCFPIFQATDSLSLDAKWHTEQPKDFKVLSSVWNLLNIYVMRPKLVIFLFCLTVLLLCYPFQTPFIKWEFALCMLDQISAVTRPDFITSPSCSCECGGVINRDRREGGAQTRPDVALSPGKRRYSRRSQDSPSLLMDISQLK